MRLGFDLRPRSYQSKGFATEPGCRKSFGEQVCLRRTRSGPGVVFPCHDHSRLRLQVGALPPSSSQGLAGS